MYPLELNPWPTDTIPGRGTRPSRSRESYERRKPNAAAHRVVHLAAASSLSHPVYCSLSRSQMLQPPHFNVAARDLAHERTCETAANPPADASPAWSCGQPRDRVAAVRARDATQRLRPAARCGLRITALISMHSHWWLLPPHARKNPIQITCRYGGVAGIVHRERRAGSW